MLALHAGPATRPLPRLAPSPLLPSLSTAPAPFSFFPLSFFRFAEVEYLPPYRCPSDYDDVLCGGGTGENTCNGDSGARPRGAPVVVRCRPWVVGCNTPAPRTLRHSEAH